MSMFSRCGSFEKPCKTCKIFYFDCACLAGSGDDDYVYASSEWIKKFSKGKRK